VDEFTPATQSEASCAAQAVILFFISYTGSFWWFSIAVNLFILIVIRVNPDTVSFVFLILLKKLHSDSFNIRKYRWIYYFAPPVLGAVLTFGIGLGNGWIRGDSGAMWCDFGYYNYGMLYTVYAILVSGTLFAIVCVGIKLRKVGLRLLFQLIIAG